MKHANNDIDVFLTFAFLIIVFLGYGFGSFVGGFGLDKIGPRQTFLSGSMTSFGCFLLFLSASFIFRKPARKFKPISQETEEMTTYT